MYLNKETIEKYQGLANLLESIEEHIVIAAKTEAVEELNALQLQIIGSKSRITDFYAFSEGFQGKSRKEHEDTCDKLVEDASRVRVEALRALGTDNNEKYNELYQKYQALADQHLSIEDELKKHVGDTSTLGSDNRSYRSATSDHEQSSNLLTVDNPLTRHSSRSSKVSSLQTIAEGSEPNPS